MSVVAAPEGAVVVASGGAIVAGSEALIAGGAILMANAASNKAQGYQRGNKNSNKVNSNFSNSRKMTNDEISRYLVA